MASPIRPMRSGKTTAAVQLLLLTLMEVGILIGVVHSCISGEQEALMKFKQGVEDPHNRLGSWIAGTNCCSWKGIGCDDRTGQVMVLDLRGESLRGEIDPSLCYLKQIQYLDMSLNNFSVSKLNFIDCFQELRYLNLSASFLFDTLVTPPQQLGNLSKLHTLDLSRNFGLVLHDATWLGYLSSLHFIDLSGLDLPNSTNWIQSLNKLPFVSVILCKDCSIGSLPQALPLVNFTSLVTLDLSDSCLETELPGWLFEITNLEKLFLKAVHCDKNEHVFPTTISNLKKLKMLDLSWNNFKGSISDNYFETILSLQELYISFNNFNGSIPTSLGKLSAMKYLSLYVNRFSGSIPTSLGKLRSLLSLDIASNNLSGKIPTSLGSLQLLKCLYLSYNKLTGSIPTSIWNLRSLEELYFPGNELEGQIPESICELTALKKIFISENDKINGTFPNCFWRLKEMEELSIGGKEFEIEINESDLQSMTKLDILSIDSPKSLVMNLSSDWVPTFRLSVLAIASSNMSMEFPKWVRSQDKLNSLELSGLGIFGNLPTWIWNFSSEIVRISLPNNYMTGSLPNPSYRTRLFSIDLSANKFQGSNWLHNVSETLPAMQTLYLSLNNFNGNIPSSLCNLSSLYELDLSDNNFSGDIPDCLMRVDTLRLANNMLHGKLPSLIEKICPTTSLHLENNKLTGVLPSSWKKCTRMVVLDLGKNKLTGNIPKWLGESMSSLKVLSLRENNFSGNVPQELSKLDALQVLDFANNNFSGKIPHTFENFTGMKSANHISVVMKGKILPPSSSFNHENISVVMKGKEMTYSSNILLTLLRSIDLSCNSLSGEIPPELGDLIYLKTLNLSHNHLTSNIPSMLGKLHVLETLDLSRNYLSGEIPQEMLMMESLNHLNLSYNNLSGRIPKDKQFNTFTNLSFLGNPNLCGFPLSRTCVDDHQPKTNNYGDKDRKDDPELWICISMIGGFAVGFWIFYGILIFKQNWRFVYFQLLSDVNHKLYNAFFI